MKVLVTGANGQLGYDVINVLEQRVKILISLILKLQKILL